MQEMRVAKHSGRTAHLDHTHLLRPPRSPLSAPLAAMATPRWHNRSMPSTARESAAASPEDRDTGAQQTPAAQARQPDATAQAGMAQAQAFNDDDPPPLHRMPAAPLRWALQLFACLSLATGIAGIFIPGLPTTVFVLMAGWAAARSSQRMHTWLWRHRLFGPMLRNWARGGCVSRRAKWSASAMMSLCAVILLWTRPPAWVQAVALTSMGCVLVWLWFRPEP